MEKDKIILAFLAIALLLTIIGVSGATPVRTAGVTAGDTFTYGNASFNWYSNDPTATPPGEWADLNGTAWFTGTIVSVEGTNVTANLLAHYNNGTEATESGWQDVDTGDGNMTLFLISANLNAGDPIYSNDTYSSWTINETIPETYPGGSRDTNHFNTTMEESVEGYNIYVSMDLYWDRATGVLTKLSITDNETITYTTDYSISFELTGSSTFVVPEFVGLPLILLVPMSFTLVTLARMRKLRKPQSH